MDPSKLRKEIEEAVNRNSAENGSDTPDFILGEYLMDCLSAFDKAVVARAKWYGIEPKGVKHLKELIEEEAANAARTEPPSTSAPVKKHTITTDPAHPDLGQCGPNKQNKVYLVLPEEERAKGFVRPVRTSYIHNRGPKPKYPIREITDEQRQRYGDEGYTHYEEYPKGSPESKGGVLGQFWTANGLKGGCGVVTSMGITLAETYARDPKFYNSTFCCGCNKHLPVEEFTWDGTEEVVGS